MNNTRYLLAFSGGCILVWCLPPLPFVWLLALLGAMALLCLRWCRTRTLGCVLLGFGFASLWVLQWLQHQLPESEQAFELRVSGVVQAPETGDPTRFYLIVSDAQWLRDVAVPAVDPSKLRLSWRDAEPELKAGDWLEVAVRVRRPRGLANPGGYDYRRWLIANGVDGTGYVIPTETYVWHSYRERPPRGLTGFVAALDRWRLQQVSGLMEAPALLYPELLAALSLGYRSGLSDAQWELFERAGLIHLMVISGLHIGFAAALGFWVAWLPSRVTVLLGWARTAQGIQWLSSLVVGAGYAFAAGLSLPTQRALIMLLVLVASRLWRLNLSPWNVWAIALVMVLINDPRAPLQDGFWMSFGAVAVLIAAFFGAGHSSFWASLVKLQASLFVGFSGVLLALGKLVSLLGPVINLLVVPLVGCVVVPLLLLAMLAHVSLPIGAPAEFLWRCADFLMFCLMSGLGFVQAQWGLPVWQSAAPFLCAAMLLSAAVVLLVPRRSLQVWSLLSVVLLMCFSAWSPPRHAYFLRMFDVGQGTALVLQQSGYALLYDAGPRFEGGFDSGESVVVPSLGLLRITPDVLIVSHGDQDHAGGVAAIQRAFPGLPTLAGQPQRLAGAEPCTQGQQWSRGEVVYRVLHPAPATAGGSVQSANDASCVLLIEFAQQSILLVGDISESVERRLLENPDLPNSVEVLLVAHHGSISSSGVPFLNRVHPKIALISAGYGNQFGHPHATVVRRLEARNSQIYNTAYAGAVDLRWDTLDATPVVSTARSGYRFWWQH